LHRALFRYPSYITSLHELQKAESQRDVIVIGPLVGTLFITCWQILTEQRQGIAVPAAAPEDLEN